MQYNGVLTIKPKHYKTTRSTDLGKMDPYLKIYLGDKILKTKVYDGAGQECEFDDQFDEMITDLNDFRVVVKDKDLMSSDYVCNGNVPLQDVVQNGSATEKVKLYYEGEHCGDVTFFLKFDLTME